MNRFKALGCGVLLGCALVAAPAYAKQWAIVVGINSYPKGEAAGFPSLQGAVNDAKLLAATLRRRGVDLPDSRILLDSRATVANFKATWKQLLTVAQPGDTLIATFAGHGGQEMEFDDPRDEKDGKDETLIFHDFDPKNPQRGRLSDDELYALFAQSQAFQVIFVADTCHSGGLTRAVAIPSALPSRGILDTFKPNPPAAERANPGGNDGQILQNVTYLSATEDEAKEIPEIRAPDGQAHGALSWSFAKAFTGDADQDHNQIVTRRELEQYVTAQVPVLTAQRQYPGLLPRGNQDPAFSLAANTTQAGGKPPSPSDTPAIALKVSGGALPAGLQHVRTDTAAPLVQFQITDGKATAFNTYGDRLTAFAAGDLAAWQKLIDKYRLMAALDGRYNTQATPVKITLQQGNGLHRLQERLAFSFDPNSDRRYFLLFDLAGSGELQFLYPLAEQNDPPALAQIPYALALDVLPPTGEDDLVAVFCQQPQDAAVALLRQHNGKAPPNPEALLHSLSKDCQIGRYAFFTQD
ncbi:MAG: caspase family protein [Candidatus Methylumidiphilus sp.]